ncbi:MAG: TrkH family potassium uptake protein [Fermentimonas sp.]|jgi:trk system potassium uptake protein TrkH
MSKFNYRFVLNAVGLVMLVEAVFMVISGFVGLSFGENVTKYIYLSAIITASVGGFLIFLGEHQRRKSSHITKREVYITVTFVWLTLTVFGTFPYLLSGAISTFTNAFFESICGFTTTGSSTILNIEAFPKSLLFWRSFTQWIGGVGIIIFVLSFMPIFGAASGQVYDAEATGIAEDVFRPRIKEITTTIAYTYLGLTFVGFLALWAGPMNAFDAACHSFSAISTGGFSTKQSSIAYFNSPYVEYVITVLMFLGGTNFMLISGLFTKFSMSLFKSEEFRWYFWIIIIFTFVISVTLSATGQMKGIENTFRTVLFQVVAAVTTTGFATADFVAWGPFYWLLFLSLILFCACEGSTSGGMKISRLIVLSKNTVLVFKRQVHPNALYMVKINGKIISDEVLSKVMSFVFLFVALAIFGATVLTLTGLNFEESISISISSLSNYGFGLGSFGPSGSFESATTFTKYFMAFLMLVGRLEIFTVISLFVPGFWKR